MARSAGVLALVFWVLMLIWFIDLWISGPALRAFIPWLAVLLLGFAALGLPAMATTGGRALDDRDRRVP